MITRHRAACLAAAALTILAGLASRKIPGLFPAALGKYPGDALWALMVFFGLGAMWRGVSTRRLAACALLVSYLVEFSQLYQAPWIEAIRSTTLGHLVLGSRFSWWDLLAYAIGVGAGAAFEALLSSAPAGSQTFYGKASPSGRPATGQRSGT